MIGEAACHIPEPIIQEYSHIPWRNMRDMRNILIHEYFGINTEIIWKTVTDKLPPLKPQLKEIIEEQRQKGLLS